MYQMLDIDKMCAKYSEQKSGYNEDTIKILVLIPEQMRLQIW
jgi:hypothetical protein